jgi:tRNA threonylcarbamoyladenosine biosynthesis protein TsaB
MILALETGGELASLALLEERVVVAERAFRHRMALSRDLLPQMDSLLAQAGVDWPDIEAVAVGLGPGSYTGLRIGVVTAKSLAWSAGKPVIGIPSLAALVAPFPVSSDTLLCAVLEARAGEFYTALYQRRGADLQVRAEPTVLPAAALAVRLAAYPGPVLLAGHAARCTRALSEATVDEAAHGQLMPAGNGAPSLLSLTEMDEEPQARWIGRLAAQRLQLGETDNPALLAPLYVRPPAPTLRSVVRKGEK